MRTRRSTRLLACLLSLLLMVAAFPALGVTALAPIGTVAGDMETAPGTNTYNLFNSGASGSGKSNGYNPDASSYTNSGYDIYASYSSLPTARLGLSFTVSQAVTERASLTIYAYDVDESQGERDIIHLVDETDGSRTRLSGYLSGMNSQWNTTVLYIDPGAFEVGHTYHFELTESVSGWVVYVRTVSLQLSTENTTGGGNTPVVVDHTFSASINSSGRVTTDLYLKTSANMNLSLEYAASIQNDQRGSALNQSVAATPSGVTKNVSFQLESGSPYGTYSIDVILKDGSGNVIATYQTTASYSPAAGRYVAVNYNSNGGSNNLPIDTTSYSSGSTVTVLFNYLPSRSGYVFLGWSTDRYATTPTYTQNGNRTFTIGNSDVTLYAVWKDNTVHTHTPGNWVTDVNPTCTTAGHKYRACADCGDQMDEAYISPLGHNYTSTVTKAATCTEPGIITHTCSNCGDVYNTFVYSEHKYTLAQHVKATCTEDGKNIYTCEICGDSYEETIPGGHDYVATVTKLASPTEEGLITYTCSICGDVYTETIPVRPLATVLLVQDTLPWTENVNTALLKHLQSEGYVSGWDMVTTATLSTVNLASYSMIYIANDQTTATYEQLSLLSASIESYVEVGGVVIYGACDSGWSAGYIHHTLPGGVTKENYYSYHNYIVNRDHPIVNGKLTDGNPLTNELLYSTYSSHTYFDNLPADATVILSDANGKPTLVEYTVGKGRVIASGLTWEYTFVRDFVLGTNFAESAMDDLLVYGLSMGGTCEHVFDVGTPVPPTCTDEGYTPHTCSLCGTVMKDTYVPAKGHLPGPWAIERVPTATTTGLNAQRCLTCGEIIDSEILPMTDAPIIKVIASTGEIILGSTVEILITVSDSDPFKSLALTPLFDSNVFELVSAEWLVSAPLQTIEAATNRGFAAWDSATAINGDVYRIVLRAKSFTTGSQITAEALMQDENDLVALSVVGDTVAIVGCPHTNLTYTDLNADYHAATCVDCGYARIVSHSYDNGCDSSCNNCGRERATHHSPSPLWHTDANGHWHICATCGERVGEAAHVYDSDLDIYCNDCSHCRRTPGDLDGTDGVTSDDAMLLLKYTFYPDDYPINQTADFDGNGVVNSDDAIYLLMYSFFPNDYPLN